MVKNSGKSESTFIREILLKAEATESQSFNNGFNKGIKIIKIKCPICGDIMDIDFSKHPKAYPKICEALKGYVHLECDEKQKKEKEAEKQRKAKE